MMLGWGVWIVLVERVKFFLCLQSLDSSPGWIECKQKEKKEREKGKIECK